MTKPRDRMDSGDPVYRCTIDGRPFELFFHVKNRCLRIDAPHITSVRDKPPAG